MLFETLNSSTLVVTGQHFTGLALTITIAQIGMGNITLVLMKLGWALFLVLKRKTTSEKTMAHKLQQINGMVHQKSG
jgi:hypothetical protein